MSMYDWIREQDRRDEKRRLEERARQASYEKEEAESRARQARANAEREIADAQRAAAYAVEDAERKHNEVVAAADALADAVEAGLLTQQGGPIVEALTTYRVVRNQ